MAGIGGLRGAAALCAVVLAMVSTACGRIITVDNNAPADFNNIQAAINDANDADTVEIQPGTYTGPGNRDIEFNGKEITVRSIDPNDPDVVAMTTIDCNGRQAEPHRGFYFSAEDETPVLNGLTITNGYAENGGGIWSGSDNLILTNCRFLGNSAAEYGGGVNANGSVTLTNCTFSENRVWRGGGAMRAFAGTWTMIGCLFSGNSAQRGGAIECEEGSVIINSCTFAENSADNQGGAIYAYDSPCTLANCILWDNEAPTGSQVYGPIGPFERRYRNFIKVSYSNIQGGQAGIYLPEPIPQLRWRRGNIDTDPDFVGPGDHHLVFGSPCIDAGDPDYIAGPAETDIDGNPRVFGARIDMGAHEFAPPAPMIEVSATEFEFSAIERGSNPGIQGLSIQNIGLTTLNWAVTEECPWLEVNPKTGSSTGEPDEITLTVDISGLATGIYNCDLIVSDPCAINNPQIIGVKLVVAGPQISLSASELVFGTDEGIPPAPRILTIANSGIGVLEWAIATTCDWLHVNPNTGTSAEEPTQVVLTPDISGLTKGTYSCDLIVSDPYGYHTKTVAIGLYITDYDSGLFVPSEYPTIQAAIDDCNDGDIIIVEPNTYTGPGNRDIDFRGKPITVRSVDPANPAVVAATIIDCNGSQADPHRGFYFHSAEGPDSVLSGLTITNGYVYDANGGAIYFSEASPTIENCVITNNRAQGHSANPACDGFAADVYGGGIYCASNSNPRISYCTISNNHAVGGKGPCGFKSGEGDGRDGYGGGIYCETNSETGMAAAYTTPQRRITGLPTARSGVTLLSEARVESKQFCMCAAEAVLVSVAAYL